MTQPDLLNPPIEVIATSPRLDMIKSRLKSAGLRSYDARDDMDNIDPVLIDAASINGSQLRLIKRQMARNTDRTFILLASPGAPHLQDAITIRHESELASVPSRLKVARRKKERQHEVVLRAKSADELIGRQISTINPDPANVLFIGDGSSRFLALAATLKSIGVSVTAALTALTARDYLSKQQFSCVLVDLDERNASAEEFLRHFTDDHLLSCVPVFALAGNGIGQADEAHGDIASATEIINANMPIHDMAEAIASLAEYHKAVTPMTPERAGDHRIHDRMTGLFTREFLEHHLQNQIDSIEGELVPLSFLTLQLSSPTDGNAAGRKALPELARVLSSELRQTDCAGRIDWSTIGISMRGTSFSGGVRLAERFMHRFRSDLVDSPANPLTFGGAVAWRVIEKRSYHSASDLIKTGTTGPQTRIIRAA